MKEVDCGHQCYSKAPTANYILIGTLLLASLFYGVQIYRYHFKSKQKWKSWLGEISQGAKETFGQDVASALGVVFEPIADSYRGYERVFDEIRSEELSGLSLVFTLHDEAGIEEMQQSVHCSDSATMIEIGKLVQEQLKALVEPQVGR